MVLPLYLAMTQPEFHPIPHPAFLVLEESQIPPPGVLPVITDRLSPDAEALAKLCQGQAMVLLDFEKPPTPALRELVAHLPCPAAAPQGYADTGPVFLPPCPLHVPIETYLAPWHGREIWLEAALQMQTVTVTAAGVCFSSPSPNTVLTEGFYDQTLRCRFTQCFSETRAEFTLFDTPETLANKLDYAASLGVTRAIGLWQELGEKHLSSP